MLHRRVEQDHDPMKRRKNTRGHSFTIGTIVKFMLGGHEVRATVIEDRGPVGASGRRILRVRRELVATDPIEFEVPADDVQIAA
jgi:hypothetical protein